ncbi:CAATT-binding protein [Heterostelium album PN500]|uniref:CAATT-binding protein n=1 Tax=Heterostelium pallidum (strain ATCC 26659 / Pp 5 / PN500) TaxID=670386 RepID=D3AVN8_HETP5|nr:CAATT-binding protein [Heterostelium album PN500]EFA86361.1 CAATT-binding protein [Heterostelium album PN500]|eukprot:XP_020438466.1 CAATT-binding protein [Heterostelium album PN500]
MAGNQKNNNNNDKQGYDRRQEQKQKTGVASKIGWFGGDKKPTTTTTTTTNNNNNNNKNNNNSNKRDNNNNFNKKNQYNKNEKIVVKKEKQEEKVVKKENVTLDSTVKIEKIPDVPVIQPIINTTNDELKQIYTRAATLYTERCKSYLDEFRKRANRDDQWREKLQHTGTATDRTSSISLLVRQAPMFRLASLDILLQLVQKKSQRERELSLTTLKDLFLSTLLPNNKLKRFIDRQPFDKDVKDDDLVQWFFEDLLKSRYTLFIQILEKLSRDSVTLVRQKTIRILHGLLMKKPEQEDVLLTLLVNKLGDNDRKNASIVPELLEEIIYVHPGMKPVVIREVEQFLYRSNISHLSQFNAMRFYLAIPLDDIKDKEVSSKLISIYLAFFNVLVTKRQVNSTIITLILRGIRKAMEVSKIPISNFEDQLDSIFMISHHASLNKAIMTLALIYEMKKTNQNITDRYYRALYELLARKEFIGQFDQTPLINLIFKSIKNDTNLTRSKAMIKRALQYASIQKTSFIVGVLLMISTLIQQVPKLGDIISTPEAELNSTVKVNKSQDNNNNNNTKKSEKKKNKKEEKTTTTEESETTTAATTEEKENVENKIEYDAIKRDPQFSHADTTCLWELMVFKDHFNPSVQIFADTLLNKQPIQFKGNPSLTFTLPAFLEKFVVSNPSNKIRSTGELRITDASKNVINQFQDSLDKYLEEYYSETSKVKMPGQNTHRSGFAVDDDELDLALAGGMMPGEKDEMAQFEGMQDDDDDDDDLDGEYSYSDLEEDDFNEDEDTFAGATKKKQKKAGSSFEDDEDAIDGEDDGEVVDDDDEDFGEDGLIQPDFGEEDEDEEVDDEALDGEDDELVQPDFGDEDDLDEEDDGELPDLGEDDLLDADFDEMDGKKKKKSSSSFMDADEFEKMLEEFKPSDVGKWDNRNSKKKGAANKQAPKGKKSQDKKRKR